MSQPNKPTQNTGGNPQYQEEEPTTKPVFVNTNPVNTFMSVNIPPPITAETPYFPVENNAAAPIQSNEPYFPIQSYANNQNEQNSFQQPNEASVNIEEEEEPEEHQQQEEYELQQNEANTSFEIAGGTQAPRDAREEGQESQGGVGQQQQESQNYFGTQQPQNYFGTQQPQNYFGTQQPQNYFGTQQQQQEPQNYFGTQQSGTLPNILQTESLQITAKTTAETESAQIAPVQSRLNIGRYNLNFDDEDESLESKLLKSNVTILEREQSTLEESPITENRPKDQIDDELYSTLVALDREIDARKFVEKCSEVEDIIKETENNTIYVILGMKKVGKTTSVLFMNNEEFDEDVLEPKENVDGFKIGHGDKATTHLLRHLANTQSSCLYLDTPPFEEALNVEVDLANEVLANNVFSEAARIVPVVLLDYGKIEKAEESPFRAALIAFRKLFKNNCEPHNEVAFCFTKVPNEENFNNVLLKKKLEEVRATVIKQEIELLALIDTVIEKTNIGDIAFVRPLIDKNPNSLALRINSLTERKESSERVEFEYKLYNSTTEKVGKYCEEIKTTLKRFFTSKKFKNMNYLLDELKNLSEISKIAEFEILYDNFIVKTREYLETMVENVATALKRAITSNDELLDLHFTPIKELEVFIGEWNVHQSKHFETANVSAASLSKTLTDSARQLFEQHFFSQDNQHPDIGLETKQALEQGRAEEIAALLIQNQREQFEQRLKSLGGQNETALRFLQTAITHILKLYDNFPEDIEKEVICVTRTTEVLSAPPPKSDKEGLRDFAASAFARETREQAQIRVATKLNFLATKIPYLMLFSDAANSIIAKFPQDEVAIVSGDIDLLFSEVDDNSQSEGNQGEEDEEEEENVATASLPSQISALAQNVVALKRLTTDLQYTEVVEQFEQKIENTKNVFLQLLQQEIESKAKDFNAPKFHYILLQRLSTNEELEKLLLEVSQKAATASKIALEALITHIENIFNTCHSLLQSTPKLILDYLNLVEKVMAIDRAALNAKVESEEEKITTGLEALVEQRARDFAEELTKRHDDAASAANWKAESTQKVLKIVKSFNDLRWIDEYLNIEEIAKTEKDCVENVSNFLTELQNRCKKSADEKDYPAIASKLEALENALPLTELLGEEDEGKKMYEETEQYVDASVADFAAQVLQTAENSLGKFEEFDKLEEAIQKTNQLLEYNKKTGDNVLQEIFKLVQQRFKPIIESIVGESDNSKFELELVAEGGVAQARSWSKLLQELEVLRVQKALNALLLTNEFNIEIIISEIEAKIRNIFRDCKQKNENKSAERCIEVLAQELGSNFEEFNDYLKTIKRSREFKLRVEEMRTRLDDANKFAEGAQLLESVQSDKELYAELLRMAQAELFKRTEALIAQLERGIASERERAELENPLNFWKAFKTAFFTNLLDPNIFVQEQDKVRKQIRAIFATVEGGADVASTQGLYSELEGHLRLHNDLTRYFINALPEEAEEIQKFSTDFVEKETNYFKETSNIEEALTSVHVAVPLLNQLKQVQLLQKTVFEAQYRERFEKIKAHYVQELREKMNNVERLAAERKVDEAEGELRRVKSDIEQLAPYIDFKAEDLIIEHADAWVRIAEQEVRDEIVHSLDEYATDTKRADLKVALNRLRGLSEGGENNHRQAYEEVREALQRRLSSLSEEGWKVPAEQEDYAALITFFDNWDKLSELQAYLDPVYSSCHKAALEGALASVVNLLNVFRIRHLREKMKLTDEDVAKLFSSLLLLRSGKKRFEPVLQTSEPIFDAATQLQADIAALVRSYIEEYESFKTNVKIEELGRALHGISELSPYIARLQTLQDDEWKTYFLNPADVPRNRLLKYDESLTQIEGLVESIVMKAQDSWQHAAYSDFDLNMLYLRDAETLRPEGILEENFSYKTVLAQCISYVNRDSAQIIDKINKKTFDKEMETLLENLLVVERQLEHTEELRETCAKHTETILNILEEIIENSANELAEQFSNIKEFAQELRELESIGYHVLVIEESVRKRNTSIIDQYCKQKGLKGMLDLCQELEQMNDKIANLIIHIYSKFIPIIDYKKNAIMKERDDLKIMLSELRVEMPDNSIRTLTEKDREWTLLKQSYEEYIRQYQEVTKEYKDLRKVEKLNNLGQILRQSKVQGNPLSLQNWTVESKEKVVKLLAQIFAFWTFSHITEDFENDVNALGYQREPKVTQVLSLLVLFNLHVENSGGGGVAAELSNQLIQIKTGEGKSVILGVASTLFALLGYEVDVACYSAYLSDRDFKSFEEVFIGCDVHKRVHYGTFLKLSRDIIENQGNLVTMTRNLVKGEALAVQTTTNVQRVLLIDEVDVFFSADFYGRTFNPINLFVDKNGHIKQIMKEIWKNRKLEVAELQNHIVAQTSYQNLLNDYDYWRELFALHVRLMVQRVTQFEEHRGKYIVKDGKIGYELQDSVSFDTAYGYLTTFAYFEEWELQKVSDTQLDERLGLNLFCGNLSYAEIPKSYTKKFGVTGTLETLHEEQKKLIKDYIEKSNYASSMYNKENLEIDENKGFMVVASENQFYSEIKEYSEEKIDRGQALLIFFRTRAALEKYLDSEYVVTAKANYNVITEETEFKQGLVEQASASKQITLLTREFGRGTDFYCYDESVQKAGGVAVLQTFFSKDLSEEIQIKGRTARWSQKGEYRCVVFGDDLREDFKVSLLEVGDLSQKSQENGAKASLEKTRDKAWGEHVRALVESNNQAIDLHNRTKQYREYVIAGNTVQAKEFIRSEGIKQVKKLFVGKNLHFVFVLDKSYSMIDPKNTFNRWEALLHATKEFVTARNQNTEGKTGDLFSLILYSNTARLIDCFKPIAEFETVITQAKIEEEGTNFCSAIQKLTNLFEDKNENKYEEQKDINKVVLFMSDGENDPNISSSEVQIMCKNFNDRFGAEVTAWWNMGFGPDAQTGMLLSMIEWLPNCHATFKNALRAEDLDREFSNLAQVTVQADTVMEAGDL